MTRINHNWTLINVRAREWVCKNESERERVDRKGLTNEKHCLCAHNKLQRYTETSNDKQKHTHTILQTTRTLHAMRPRISNAQSPILIATLATIRQRKSGRPSAHRLPRTRRTNRKLARQNRLRIHNKQQWRSRKTLPLGRSTPLTNATLYSVSLPLTLSLPPSSPSLSLSQSLAW